MSRHWPTLAGIAVLGLAWSGAFGRMLGHGFTAHMAMHMAVVAIAAPLISLGIAGRIAARIGHGRLLRAALIFSLLEFLIVWGWHSPALHLFARSSATGLVLEQGSFLLVSLALWAVALGDPGEHGAAPRAAGVVALLLTSMHMTLLGALLVLAPRPLYPLAHSGHGALANALVDQQLGGTVMLAVGGASYLLGGLRLTAGLLREGATRRDERSGHVYRA